MSDTNEASGLHKQAASDHDAAAKHHRKAAECHDQNKLSDAKSRSKSAMDCCNKAQKQQPKTSSNAHAPRKPFNLRQFPLNAQTEATAGREKVREVAHPVNAPRQTKRRVERRTKSQTGT